MKVQSTGWRVCILGVAVIGFAGVGTALGQLKVLDGQCNVQLDPNCSPLDFGAVGVGSAPVVISLRCLNTGPTAVTGLLLTVPGANGFSAGLDPLAPSIAGFGSDYFDIQLDTASVGVKAGTVTIGSVELLDLEFDVVGEVLAPGEVSVDLDGNDVPDGSVIPIDLGTRFQGEAAPILTFTVHNTGAAPLQVGGVLLPPAGFNLVTDLPSQVDPCTSEIFQIQLDTTSVGVFTGDVSFTNDDGGLLFGDNIDENPYSFAIQGTVALDNDECDGAIPVLAQESYFGSNVGATGSVGSSCGVNDVNDVWHSFTPEATHEYVIDLCGSDFDTVLAIYDNCGGNELICNDEDDDLSGAGVCGTKPWESSAQLELQQGMTYYIRVSGYAGSAVGESGDYILTVTGPVCTGLIPADLTGDCLVDLRDFVMFASYWLECNLDPPDACY